MTNSESKTSRRSPRKPDRQAAARKVLVPRDRQILEALYVYGILNRKQIQKLIFGPTLTSIAKLRLRILFDKELVQRQFVAITKGNIATEPVYRLTPKGYKAIGITKKKVSDVHEFHIYHSLAMNDVRISFERDVRTLGYKMAKWMMDAEIKHLQPVHAEVVQIPKENTKPQRVPMLPDSFFVIEDIPPLDGETKQRRAAFFLEVDMSSLDHLRWKKRVLAYKKYVKSGNFSERYEVGKIRILVVATSAERMRRLKTSTEEMGGGNIFWFASLEDVNQQSPLKSPIWLVTGSDSPTPLIS